MSDGRRWPPDGDDRVRLGDLGLDLRVGTDVQPVDEVEQAVRERGERYLRRLFTTQEVADCGGPDADPAVLAPGLAARFAAKEATLKALRTGRDVVPLWTEIEVVRMPEGWTDLALWGQSADMARSAGLVLLRLSMSHGGGIATATVVGIGLTRQ